MTAIERSIELLISPQINAMGFEIIRVKLIERKTKILQIMIDRSDYSGVNLDECAEVSRTVSTILDVEDPVDGEYNLEVSSPGLERPLTKPDHFDHFIGFKAKVSMQSPIDGRKHYSGIVNGMSDNLEDIHLIINDDGNNEHIALPLNEVEKAKLVITEELLKLEAGKPILKREKITVN